MDETTIQATGKDYKIDIPRSQTLDESSKERLAALAAPDPRRMLKGYDRHLESIDPRFRARTTATQDGTVTEFMAVDDEARMEIEFNANR